MPDRIPFKEFRVIMPEHVRTRTRWRDDIPRCILENFYRVFRDGTRILAETGVELRLSAAGLLAGEVHGNAEVRENIHDGLTSFREE